MERERGRGDVSAGWDEERMRQALSQSMRQTESYRIAAHSAAALGAGGGAHMKAGAGGMSSSSSSGSLGGGGDYAPLRSPPILPGAGQGPGRGPGSQELIKRAEVHREAARKAEYGYSVVQGQGGQGGEAFLVSARRHSFLAQQSFLMALNDGLLLDPDAAQRCEVRLIRLVPPIHPSYPHSTYLTPWSLSLNRCSSRALCSAGSPR